MNPRHTDGKTVVTLKVLRVKFFHTRYLENLLFQGDSVVEIIRDDIVERSGFHLENSQRGATTYLFPVLTEMTFLGAGTHQ